MMATAQASTESPTLGSVLLAPLADNWWLVLLRGIAAIAFGVLAFFWPGLTLLTLTFLWGFYTIADGVFSLWAGLSGTGTTRTSSRWWLALIGVVSIVAGGLAFFYPGMTQFVLLIFIASWAIVIGILSIVGAIQLRKELDDEWLMILGGLVSIGFGVLVFLMPGAGALSLVWIIAWYAVFAGVTYIALAFRLRKHKRAA
jgi:uncharacterized membrane protein HdeD (DUF308 family)